MRGLLLVMALGCGAAPRLPPPPMIADPHDGAVLPRRSLELRRPRSLIKQEITIGIRDLASGQGFAGRGVVIIAPRHALRMILLGPGGTTAMDVWIVDERFRVAIPALQRVVRGDASTPRASMRGMPVDLLWRLLVDPFGGLVYARRVEGGFAAWMRRGAGAAEIRVRSVDGMRAWFFERGRVSGVVSGVESTGDPVVPLRVDYVGTDPAMEVHVETTAMTPLDTVAPAVFADPDTMGVAP